MKARCGKCHHLLERMHARVVAFIDQGPELLSTSANAAAVCWCTAVCAWPRFGQDTLERVVSWIGALVRKHCNQVRLLTSCGASTLRCSRSSHFGRAAVALIAVCGGLRC